MSLPDWEEAPEWASVLLVRISEGGYAWAVAHKNNALARRVDMNVTFNLSASLWDIVSLRPTKAPAWNGEGLPPVGTVCEYQVDDGPWYECNINYVFNDGEEDCAVIYCPHLEHEQYGIIGPGIGSLAFRPIRTPEQIAADEREKAVEDMAGLSPLLDKGWSKRVCAALYDAGYRLTKQD